MLVGALAAAALTAALPFAASAPASPPAPPGLGRLVENTTTGEISGSFVSFFAPGSGNIVEDYASAGIAFFDAVAVEGYVLSTKTFIGPFVKIVGTGATAQAHDIPSSNLVITLDSNATAVFVLASGISAASGPNGTLALSAAGSERAAAVWTSCGLGAAVIAPGGESFTVNSANGCRTFFRSQVLDPASEALITSAAEAQLLSAEVYVGETAGDGADVASYGDAIVIVSHADGRTVVSVESQSNQPTSVLIRFVAPGPFATTQVLVDGHPVKLADGLEDSLDATNDGTAVEYSVTAYDGTGVLVVSIPSPSSHVIEIESVAVEPARDTLAPLLGVAFGLAAVAAAALALFRRR